MKKLYILLVCLGVLCLAACDSGKKEEAPAPSAKKEQAQPAPAKPKADADAGSAPKEQGPPPTQAQVDAADAVVAYYNVVAITLADPYFVQADELMSNVRSYLQEWQLAPRPAGGKGKAVAARLAAPKGMFTEDESRTLAQWVADMNQSIDSMRADYGALERYVKDESIRDDGVKGAALTASIEKSHEKFMAARDSYLGTVEARASAEEEVLLYGHPLKRQILEAKKIFGLFSRTAGLLVAQKPERAALEQVMAKLDASLNNAGRPPFPAAPAVERAYRNFLKQSAEFKVVLAKGLAEGFYNPVREELNTAALSSRQAYNAFARAVNAN
ncbi:MAG: hypothetical protein PHI96_00520 [Desulfovibrio sp.]|nr:hypothetical protein [Desulfovibrio sp.]